MKYKGKSHESKEERKRFVRLPDCITSDREVATYFCKRKGDYYIHSKTK